MAANFSGLPSAAFGANLRFRANGGAEVVLDHYRHASGLLPIERIGYEITAEPCPFGDTAAIEITSIPQDIQNEAEAFEAWVNGEVIVLPGGAFPGVRRVVKIPDAAHGLAEIRLRIVWRDRDERITNLRSDWSSATHVIGVADAAAPRLEITADQTTINEGEGVSFSAAVFGAGPIYDTPDVAFRWDYGDPGATHKRLTPDFVALHGDDANVSYDKLGAHVYETAGVKTVTCLAWARGRDGVLIPVSASIAITVIANSLTFSGGDGEGATCIIDNVTGEGWRANAPVIESGNANAALDGLRVFNTVYTALDHYSRAVGGQKKRVRALLRNGQTHRSLNLKRNGIEVVHLDATEPDAANLPETDPTGSSTNSAVIELGSGVADHKPASIRNINFTGPFDPTLPGQDRPRDCIHSYLPKLTLHNVGIRGWNVLIRPRINSTFIASSVHLTEWANYGLLGISPEAAEIGAQRMVGCTWAQNPLTRRAEGKGEASNVTADHGPYRFSNPQPGLTASIAFIQCDLASFNTWATQNTVQLVQRWGAFGTPGTVFQMSQCLSEGGSLYVGPSAAPYGSAVIDAKIAKCVHVCAAGGVMGSGYTGVVFENNILVVNDTPESPPLSHMGGSEVHDFGTIGNASDAAQDVWHRNRPDKGLCSQFPLTYRNNTFVDMALAHRGDFQSVRIGASWLPRAIVGDNVIHAPHLPEIGPFANLDLSEVFATRYRGRLVLGENGDQIQPQYSNEGFGFRPEPLPGCPAIGAATLEAGAIDDFHGNIRADVLAGLSRSTPSSGAIEPALEA